MISLNELKIGDEATVTKVSAKESIRKRLLDIGLVKGTKIKKVLVSSGNNMVAYSIKGAIIAIRKEDTKDIMVIR